MPLRATGAFLLVFAAIVAFLATRPDPARGGVRAVIVTNVAWVVGSLAVLAAGWYEPTAAGQVWIVLQALVVAAFAPSRPMPFAGSQSSSASSPAARRRSPRGWRGAATSST